jgi:uncharacterized protein YjbI with pentapeptide repeats
MIAPRNALIALMAVGGLLTGCTGSTTAETVPVSRAAATPSAGASVGAATSYLFAVSGEQGTIDGIGQDTGGETLTVTLNGVNDHATQFADRPIRNAYVLSTTDLVDRWDTWFANDPPNAVLSYTEAGDPMPHNIVVELTNPIYDESARTLAFTARHLHRQPDLSPSAKEAIAPPRRVAPAVFTGGTLFIDSVVDADELGDSPWASDHASDPAASESGNAIADPDTVPSDPVENDVNAEGRLTAAGFRTVNGCEISPMSECHGADLAGADLSNEELSRVDLRNANLRGANLSGSHLWRANLAGANLSGARLSEAYLADANLSGATVNNAYMPGVDLRRANLSGANFSYSIMNGANLSDTNLSGTNLSNSFLSLARFQGANVDGANLKGANLNRAWWIDASRCDDVLGVCHRTT